jgi:hypothetical protein
MKAGKYHSYDWRTERDADANRSVFRAAWKAKFPGVVPQFAIILDDGSCHWWNEWPDGRTRRLPPGTFNIE